MNSNILKTLSQVERIEPKIHQIHFSSQFHYTNFPFSADDFEKVMTPYQVSIKSKTYRDGLFLEYSGETIEVRYDQKNRESGFYIIMSNPKPFILLCLMDKFKILNLSSVEYTIDLFCSDSSTVRKLYYLLKKYLVLKYKRKQFIRFYENKPEFNFSNYIDDKFKIYERGNDNLRLENNAWRFDDIDRLRLEFTANRYYLKKILRIRNFDDFIDDCRFNSFISYLLFYRIFFMKFDPSQKHLPKETETYGIGKKPENQNCIMYYKQKKNIPFNNLIESDEFQQIKYKIIDEVRLFDEEWESEAVDYRRIMYMK